MNNGSPSALNPEESQAWDAFSAVLSWLPAAIDARMRDTAGITNAEFTVLSWLSNSPDRRQRMSDTAAACSVSPSHLSRIIARLEQRGWVSRSPDDTDRRTTYATLTAAGELKVTECAPTHAANARELVLRKLTPEQIGHLKSLGDALNDVSQPTESHPLSPNN